MTSVKYVGYADLDIADKNVKLLGMWSWHAKAPQIAVSGISIFTFLRSIGTAASVWPIPLLRGTDATFSFPPGSLQVSLSAIVGICRRWL
jgi:hypothetical protein